jgi:hypothetical protein
MRRKAALKRLREQDFDLFRDEVRRAVFAGLTKKQIAVIEAIKAGARYISLCCGRRAGKTNLIAKLLILTLLDCGHNEAVFYVAYSLKIGKGLIWKELAKLCDDYGLDEYWRLTEHTGQIDTPQGGAFFIMGLNKAKQSNLTRGFKGKLFCTDESQDIEHLLAKTLTAVSPGLTDMRGVFLAAGTGAYVTMGTWYDWSQGLDGFQAFNWTILDNEKFPQDPHETLREERERKKWDEKHPDYLREWLGKAADDVSTLMCEYVGARNGIDELPPEYTAEWRHVIGMDYGWDDAITWVVVAANQFGPERIVVHAEGASKIDNDEAAAITARLVRDFQTSYVVCDPAGGGKGFYETFNARYGDRLGCQITAAYKLGKVDSVKNINTDLRTGRMKVLLPAAEALAKELRVLRWKDKQKGEVLTGSDVRDDHFDAFRYACAEIAPWREKDAPPPEKIERIRAEQQLRERMRNDPELREREQRNRAARKQASGPWWGAR